jgi:hypothetical protein
MKLVKRYHYFIFPIIVTVILFVVSFPFQKIPDGIPDGVPIDYFDRIDVLNDNDVDLFIFSDEIDFDDDYETIQISNYGDLSSANTNHVNVLVIDMNKNVQMPFSTRQQIKELYKLNFFTIMFVNYESSDISQYSSFIGEIGDNDSGIITFEYDADSDTWYGGSYLSGSFSKQMLMYAIVHDVSLMIEENKNRYQ